MIWFKEKLLQIDLLLELDSPFQRNYTVGKPG